MTESTKNEKTFNNDEIDLVEIFRKVWNDRKIVFKSIIVFFTVGIIYVIGTPKLFKSEATLLVESGLKGNGASSLLQQFGGIAGINIGSNTGSDVLTPEIYPIVLRSAPFLLEVLNKKIVESKFDSTITIANYFENYCRPSLGGIIKNYTLGLPSKLIGVLKKSSPEKQTLRYQKSNQKLLDIASVLSGSIKLEQGSSTNVFNISVEVQDPHVAVQLLDSIITSLTFYIIDYRTQKSKNDLQFIKERTTEAELKYVKAQQLLAVQRDRNKNIITATASMELERLQAEYNLAFSVYSGLSQQLEQAKIKVQETTPVFKIIDPAKEPLSKSKPNTGLILIEMLFVGVILGIGIVFLKLLVSKYKK